jgi:enamine deaminase RidA (YjgF/YER057c/UK114 family)
MSVEARLLRLGIDLPASAAPLANYIPSNRTGNLLMISSQGPVLNGAVEARFRGKAGGSISVETGQAAARLAGINVLAQAKLALGSLDKVKRVIRLGGFVNSAPGFTAQPAVMNGASDLMVEIFGENGRHVRTTVGVSELPLDGVIAVEAMFEVE